MRSPFACLLACALLFAGSASAQVVQEYTYAADRIHPIRTGLGITTQIELSPSEKVVDCCGSKRCATARHRIG